MIKNFFFNKEDAKVTIMPNTIIRKVLAYNDNLMIVENEFPTAGIVADLHSHPHEQITYIVSGVFEFTIGDQKKIVKAGDSMYKEPNIIHGAVCIEPGVLIDCFTPHRQDYV
ncbi:cupin domain-containing protein [Acholeplasma granularum]|uniref:cupin domain-containing protein n=1 Tax=Acholeplasma granularum TaxID=264635 RepID=UPI00046F623F|nr:cupin domain-containing protein [Acholeplasma granularum]